VPRSVTSGVSNSNTSTTCSQHDDHVAFDCALGECAAVKRDMIMLPPGFGRDGRDGRPPNVTYDQRVLMMIISRLTVTDRVR
jgi:hypothetical protein